MKQRKQQRITVSGQRELIAQLKAAVVEKDVETAYKGIFQKYYGSPFSSHHGSDGYLEPTQGTLFGDGIRLLLEVKFNHELTKKIERAKIVAQAIYYLKKFEQRGALLPNVIVGGDENEIFTVYAPKLYEYLTRDYDWSIPPSAAWQRNAPLMRELTDDPNLNVFVFDVRSSAFDINELFRSIDLLSQEQDFHKIRVTEANLRKVFDEFMRVVFGNEWLTGIKKLGAQESVSLFIQSILGNPDIYIVPTKKNVLHVGAGREIIINTGNYDAFFSRYDRKYDVREIDAITAVADQLIEEIKRRFHGDFWTPTVWADRAVQMISDNLGDDWRERYVVWDPAAGTKNLTRDYNFNNLYASTIHQSEIDMSRQYNKQATSFQYDFLNDDIDVNPDSDPRDLKMPAELFAALKSNQPLVFYTNPPYGQATEYEHNEKRGVADTAIGQLMRARQHRKAAAELYTQFIFRVQKLVNDFQLTDVHFFFFNKAFLASPVFEKFTNDLLSQFKFNGGFMLNAGEFQGTSSAWGIIFSNFQLDLLPREPQTEFRFSVERASENGIEKLATHTIQRVPKGESIKDWLYEIKLPKEEYNAGAYPRLNGGLNLSASKAATGTYRSGAIGFLQYNSPNVQFSNKYLSLNGAMIELGNTGRSITPANFERACVTFAVPKSILKDASWINDKDVFRRPSDSWQANADWSDFVTDCVVFSLFHPAAYQTSLRNFEYRGVSYDVYNEWFFMSKAESIALAERNQLNDVVYDARTADERFVYRYLQSSTLSTEANQLLQFGRQLVAQAFTRRFLADQEHPEWHMMTWDAGFSQTRKVLNLYKSDFTPTLAAFSLAFANLEAKIRQQVYADKILDK